MNDIVLNKINSIQRCIRRAREERALAGDAFADDYSRQDAAVLNITRACEQSIDLANHLIKTRRLGIPAGSAESFTLLARERIISAALAEQLRRMTGFRNIAVHEYQSLDTALIDSIIRDGLEDLLRFTEAAAALEEIGK